MKRLSILFLLLFTIVGSNANVCAMDRKRTTSDGLKIMPGFGSPEDGVDEDSIERMRVKNQHAAAEQRRLMRVETDGKKRQRVVQREFNSDAKNLAVSMIKNLRDNDELGSTSVLVPSDFNLLSNVESVEGVLLKAAALYVEDDPELAADLEVCGYNLKDLADDGIAVYQGDASKIIFGLSEKEKCSARTKSILNRCGFIDQRCVVPMDLDVSQSHDARPQLGRLKRKC